MLNANRMKIFRKFFLLSLSILSIIGLTACKEQITLKVIVPYGSPSYATLYLNEMRAYDVDTIIGADPLVAAFGSDQYDAIIAPTNLGAKFYQSSKDYQLAASIVWGNYYLISAQAIDIENLDDETIYTFGQNQTPDIVLKYIMSELHISPNYVYLSSSLEISTQVVLEPNYIYMIAEPDFSQLSEELGFLYYISIQNYYKEVTGQDMYPQASLFVKSSLNDDVINQLKADLEASIISIHNHDQIDNTARLLSSNMSTFYLEQSIERSNLSYQSANDAKPAIEAYFNIILETNPVLIGNCLPESDFYR